MYGYDFSTDYTVAFWKECNTAIGLCEPFSKRIYPTVIFSERVHNALRFKGSMMIVLVAGTLYMLL